MILTAELITSSAELVVDALELSAEVDAELLVETLAEVSISVDDAVDDDVPVEEAFEALSEGTTAELIGSPVELSTATPVDEAPELVTEVDEALLVES